MTKVPVPELVGGEREGRASAGPEGLEGARSERSPWRDGTTGDRVVPGTEPSTPLEVPRFERSAEEHPEDWGTRCASWVGDTAEAFVRLS